MARSTPCLKIATPEAVGQLAMLKVRVKFGTAQKEIEKAFDAAAGALRLPRDQIEEMGVPSYGLEEVGVRREQFGDGITAELRVDGRDVNLAWLRADGKPQKSVPASVKTNHKEELKELQAAAKDIAAMLPAQNERIDQAFLQQKRWNVSAWRERYLDHPLVGTIAATANLDVHTQRQADDRHLAQWGGCPTWTTSQLMLPTRAPSKALRIPSGGRWTMWSRGGRWLRAARSAAAFQAGRIAKSIS